MKTRDLVGLHTVRESGALSPTAARTDGILEWRVLHDDAGQGSVNQWPAADTAWVSACEPTPAPPAVAAIQRPWIRLGPLLLLAAIAASVYVWRVGEEGAQVLEREVQLAVAAEPLLTGQREVKPQVGLFVQLDDSSNPHSAGAALTTAEAQAVRFQGDLAIVQVVTTQRDVDGTTNVFRQEQVYQPADTGWVRASAASVDWGPVQTLESTAFRFYFVAQDRAAVLELLQREPSLDDTYARLRADFGLPSAEGKIRIDIRRETNGCTSVTGSGFQPNQICVVSPLLTPLLADMTDGEALYLWLLDAFLYVLDRESKQAAPLLPVWALANNALLRVQVQRYAPQLASLHIELLQGLRRAASAGVRSQDLQMVTSAAYQFCQRYNDHLSVTGYPGQVHRCTIGSALELLYLFNGYSGRLDHFLTPQVTSPQDFDVSTQPLETVFEYALASYGTEAAPALVDGFRRYISWSELIPAVFGLSQDEFEAGWQRYLVEEYGVEVVGENSGAAEICSGGQRQVAVGE